MIHIRTPEQIEALPATVVRYGKTYRVYRPWHGSTGRGFAPRNPEVYPADQKPDAQRRVETLNRVYPETVLILVPFLMDACDPRTGERRSYKWYALYGRASAPSGHTKKAPAKKGKK